MASLIDKYFSSADFDAIEAAVREAESHTSGEIAVELASQSHNWLRERWMHALVVTLLVVTAVLWFRRDAGWAVYFNITEALLFGVGAFLVTYFAWGKYLSRLSRRRLMVWNRAMRNFLNLDPTKAQTAVLIFVSAEERQVAIIADKGIAAKVDSDYWDEPHAKIVQSMRGANHAEGLVEAIKMIGDELAKHFPRQRDDRNELGDAPRIVD